MSINQNLEQIARDQIDRLALADWVVQSKDKVGIHTSMAVVVREYQTEQAQQIMCFL